MLNSPVGRVSKERVKNVNNFRVNTVKNIIKGLISAEDETYLSRSKMQIFVIYSLFSSLGYTY